MNIKIDGIDYGKTATKWINTVHPEREFPLLSILPDVCYVLKGGQIVIIGTSNRDSKGILTIPLDKLKEFGQDLIDTADVYAEMKGTKK